MAARNDLGVAEIEAVCWTEPGCTFMTLSCRTEWSANTWRFLE
jgi:hypothetical protein